MTASRRNLLLDEIRVYRDGVEVPAYVEDLRVRHPDGSLRAVLLVADMALRAPTPEEP